MQTKINKKYTNVVSLTWIVTFNFYSKSIIHKNNYKKSQNFALQDYAAAAFSEAIF